MSYNNVLKRLRRVRTSLWFLPAAFSVAATLLAFASIWLDRRYALGSANGFWFLFQTGAEGARGVLSTIAGSIMTVTGVVFSITIVVLQLASSQFTPRALRAFTEDRANQLVLAVFIGTFIYALLVMRSVRSEGESFGSFVPAISVTVALVLALVSIGCLIFFIHHIAHSIRVEVILDRVTRDAVEVVDDLFPENIAEPAGHHEMAEWKPPDDDVALVRAPASGYIQALDDAVLLNAAREQPLTVVMQRAVGDFVIEGDAIAQVWPARGEEAAQVVQRSITLGPERSRYQDVERGLIELADIGIRALSPSMNDPSTAIVCIDRLTEVLARLAMRRFPPDARVAAEGKLRIKTVTPGFDALIRLSYRELRHHGAADPAVALRIVSSLARVAERAPAERRGAIMRELRDVVDAADRQLKNEHDIRRVRELADSTLAAFAA